MSLAATKKKYQEAVLDGMARALWVMAYADWAHGTAVCDFCGQDLHREDNSTTWVDDTDGDTCSGNDEGENENDPHVPSTTEGPNVAAAGEDWEDAAPETPDAAYLAAAGLTKLLVSAEGMKGEKSPLAELFELAMTIDEGGFEFAEPQGSAWPSERQQKEYDRKLELAVDFGSGLAHMALGSGSSWFDDHKQKSGTGEVTLAVPDFECSYDGQDLSWSGKEGSKVSHGHQEAKYGGVGAPTTQTKIGKVTIINSNDKNFYDHSYVYAFGAYGDTLLLAYADGPDSALDECIDWLVDNAPGHIIDDQVQEEFARQKADGKSDEEAWDASEVDTISGGNAGNHVNASEVALVAEDPTRDQLFEIGRLETNPARNPAGLTAKGERMYRKIRDGYTEVGKQKAKEIAARTVLARAKSGTSGLVGDKAPHRARAQHKRRRKA